MENEKIKGQYDRVTERIVAALQAGTRPWVKPWTAEGNHGLPMRHDGRFYQGANIMNLWLETSLMGYKSQTWMTYKQAQGYGGNVRKGEHGTTVVYADRFIKKDKNEAGEEVKKQIPFMKCYTVFNVDQIDGLPVKFYTPTAKSETTVERLERVEEFIRHTGATIKTGGSRAAYATELDYIKMPPIESFSDREAYYATVLHELAHWTKHENRLARSFEGMRFGETGYAREELVAELSAAFLCAELGITPEIREDHAQYMQHWIDVLNEDHKAIFSAAAHAQRAADYLRGLQPTSSVDAVEQPEELAA